MLYFDLIFNHFLLFSTGKIQSAVHLLDIFTELDEIWRTFSGGQSQINVIQIAEL